MIKYHFCKGEFWNNNLTWNTDSPQVTTCFRETLLVWFPGLLLIIATLSEYFNIRQAKLKSFKPIQPNNYNKFRLLITILLSLIKLIQFIIHSYYGLIIILLLNPEQTSNNNFNNINDDQIDQQQQQILSLYIPSIIAPILQASWYIILVRLYLKQRSVGIHTSTSIWFFLFTFVLCDSIEFYSTLMDLGQDNLTFELSLLQIVEYIHYPLLLLLFMTECTGDTPNIEPNNEDLRPLAPELNASFFSSITFWWYNGFLAFGYKCQIKLENLWQTLKRDKSSEIVPQFKSKWASKGKTPLKPGEASYHLFDGTRQKTNSVSKVFLKLFWPRLLFAALLKFLQDCLQYLTPIILKNLIVYMTIKGEDGKDLPPQPRWHGLLFAISFLIIPTCQSLILGNYFYQMQLVGLQIKTMLVGQVYRKSLALSGSSRLQSTTGEIVNLMAVDSQRFQDLLMYSNLFWSAPFQIILAVYMLYNELGWPVFAGVICMCLVLPANTYLANRFKMKQIKLMKTKDERVKQMSEILSGIKVIKLYAWENSFINNLFNLRSREMDYLKRILTLDAVMSFLWQCSPFIVAMVTFTVYVCVDSANVLTPAKAFVALALFNLLRFPLTVLPSLVTSFVLTMVSNRRLNKFFNSDELVKYVTREDNPSGEVITIEQANLSWTSDNDDSVTTVSPATSASNGSPPKTTSLNLAEKPKSKVILKDIDLHVKPGSFVAIVGQVASGKSSLISAIVGEMHYISGRFNIAKDQTIAYVPQQAWIQNMTVRDNILFGKPYNEDLYKQVLSVCSLESDLETLSGGDLAEIGEKGINLSGGQKQRVSLARACYSNSDIFLMDDPLSALDSHVAKHVYERILSSKTGILRNKTRVLATNTLFVLPYVDHIVVLDKGKIIESGSYKSLMEKKDGTLAESMKQYLVQQASSHEVDIEFLKSDEIEPIDLIENHERSAHSSIERITKQEERIMKSIGPVQPNQETIGRLIEDERMEDGSVNYSVYLGYFKAVSVIWTFGLVFFTVSMSSFDVSTNIWLSMWTKEGKNDPDTRTTKLVVYGGLGSMQSISVFLASICLCYGSTRASKFLHAELLEKVMHSPMTFFETTPLGRIINRFAKDIDVIDSVIPQIVRNWLNCFLKIFSTILLICLSFPYFIIIILPLGIIYMLIQKIFIVTTRQLKRLESTTRSPIYSHFSETLSGIPTIRAYNCIERFVELSDNHVDVNQSCSYSNIIANRWLSVRLEFFGNLVTTCAALFSVYSKGSIGPEIVGLNISYSLSITQTLSWFVRTTSDLETNIVSIERIFEYMSNKQEDLWIKSDKRPPNNWPDKGVIRVDNYSARYREDTDLILRDLTLLVRPGEKVGIVGRTGSGKSSLSLGLFRILEPASGRIVIDNLNIVDYGLHDLRSKLTIIPQDPVLFSGSLRFNLDPLKLYSDVEIWRAIELSHLKDYIKTLESGLDFKVSEYGGNFSVGQRQLICLARAILRKSKILILDEATASVDLETDSIVQKTIRDIFSECTIITIAHRLHTILDSDRILVLERGRILELDSPVNLLSDPNSSFSGLVRDSGIDVSYLIPKDHQQGKRSCPDETPKTSDSNDLLESSNTKL